MNIFCYEEKESNCYRQGQHFFSPKINYDLINIFFGIQLCKLIFGKKYKRIDEKAKLKLFFNFWDKINKIGTYVIIIFYFLFIF